MNCCDRKTLELRDVQLEYKHRKPILCTRNVRRTFGTSAEAFNDRHQNFCYTAVKPAKGAAEWKLRLRQEELQASGMRFGP